MATKTSNESTTTQGLTKEQIEAINNYSKEIIEIEGFVNQVRTRPTMYLSVNEQGLFDMFREIFQNSVDQLINPKSPCDSIQVIFDERTLKFTIIDNGMGIPYDKIVDNFTKAHMGSNLKAKEKYKYSAGTNGVGAKATNALSEYFDIKSYRYDGTAMHARFEKGIPKVVENIPNEDHYQGTIVEFIPDKTILGDIQLDESRVYIFIKDILSLIPIGSKITYTHINPRGKVNTEEMVNLNGISQNILDKCENMLIPPIIISYDNGDMKLDTAFTFDKEDFGGEDISAYANMCPTSTVTKLSSDNTHVQGTLDGITTWYCNYMNKTYLSAREKEKLKIMPIDVRAGLKLMISAWHLEPQFIGQAKEVFSNQDYRPFAKDVVMTGLDGWAKQKPQDLLKVCKYLKDIATVRTNADKEKVKITAKYAVSASSGLPAKYLKPKGKKNLELFIVEGDSAMGSARNARDVETQGIFPIRGKILNVAQATPQKIAANAEVMGIVHILGAGYGRSFDISKVKFEKIIIMTDADNDGAHIADLLLILFLKLFPGLVESGRVYKAVPPLYGIPMGKKRMKYLTDRADFVIYMRKEYYKNNVVTYMDGKPLSTDAFDYVITNYSDYQYEMEVLKERYKLDSRLVEIILTSHIKKEKFDTLRKRITSEFRFMENDNVTKMGNVIKIKGLINGRIETVFLDERFINEDCKPLIEYYEDALNKNFTWFMVNGVRMGLYEFVTDVLGNKVLNRFKGLGEMNDWQLKESTMSKDTRQLIRYDVKSIDETMRIIRQYDSNKKLILSKVKEIVNRDELIGL